MPNATVAEYGTYSILGDPSGIVHKLQSEIYARGPIATGVNAEPLVKYTGGRVDDTKVRFDCFWNDGVCVSTCLTSFRSFLISANSSGT